MHQDLANVTLAEIGPNQTADVTVTEAACKLPGLKRGSDIFVAGTGYAALTAGGGSNDYFFTDVPGIARTDLITDFDPASAVIGLPGYGGGADAVSLASAGMLGGNLTLSLSDGNNIVLAGAAYLGSSNFV